MITEILYKYLIEDDDLCVHCSKNKRKQGSSVCFKCAKELEKFRSKINKEKNK
jgi:hypothetical protein